MAMSPEAKQSALSEYFDECHEMLDRLDKNISTVEKNGTDKELLAAIYRDMHTLKGTSQLFGFAKMGRLAHVMETCLDPIRKGKAKLSDELLDSLFIGLDFITNSLEFIKEKHKEADHHEILESILAKFITAVELSITGLEALSKDKILFVDNNLPPLKNGIKQEEKRKVPVENKKEEEHVAFEIFDVPEKTGQNIVSTPKSPVQNKTEEIQTNDKKISEEQISETIRVQVNLLNNLMNLVGELVLIRNQLLQHAKLNDEDTEFLKMSQRLNVLTAELQNEVMKTRMQPIGNVLTIFSRVVRDLSKELGKKIDLVLLGVETELDKTVIEAVKDPLMHIVRNAVDHGIETIEERKKIGKKETAHIRIKAYNESGQVIIEIIDDGRGIDKDKIGAKAIEKGIISKEALAKMTEKEIQLLIFAPGFSTADVVSNISGRGVGMDVVKTNVERIGGFVDLFSVPGEGTTIIIKIPLSLAIVPALVVQTEGQRFAIPQTKLVELIRIDHSDENSEKIENLQGQSVLRLRGKLLPIISLSQVLFQKNLPTNIEKENSVSNIVILNADNFLFGLIVDEINDSADIVVKSLSQFLKDLKVFSGATIMGDGTVALTIDVLGIAETAKISIDHTNERPSSNIQTKSESTYHSDICEYLLIDTGAPSSYAIPLSIVSRLEEFESEKFELSGEQKVIRYRNSLLPIFSLPDFLELPFEDPKKIITRERTPIVVIKRGSFSYGIEVREIHDIVEVSSEINQSVKDRPGILGTIVTNEQIIVVADIFGMIDTIKLTLESQSHTHPEVGPATIHNHESTQRNIHEPIQRHKHRILLVEDSSFFRNYIRTVLLEAGFLVDTAYDGANALEILDSAPKNQFSLILSDIEMPIMDGISLAKKVKSSKNYGNIPMIAVTTKYSQEDIEEGINAGFLIYLEKLRAEKLIAELDEILIHNEKKGEK
ncbi:chemotaxis protein CheW [Fluviispira sanaruensis]|uniref:histidine kinase n=1 Tax=Fluviispira sanaruensis TaxID=2493639 RepID=A0A4P2VKP7_FLUSA|nr:chemotaxis protein CheW [Fluviispira sanaruensis]BBH53846.1 hybrid sensor histidine kinase/response regulator [Fluviispira sanaruensis]